MVKAVETEYPSLVHLLACLLFWPSLHRECLALRLYVICLFYLFGSIWSIDCFFFAFPVAIFLRFHPFSHSQLRRVWALLGAQRRLKYWWTILPWRRALQPPALQGSAASLVRIARLFSFPSPRIPDFCCANEHGSMQQHTRKQRCAVLGDAVHRLLALRANDTHLVCRTKPTYRHIVVRAIYTRIAHSVVRLMHFQGYWMHILW